jgi:integrase
MRTAEVVALRIQHVDFLRFYINPKHQNDGEELKSTTSETPIPISEELARDLSAAVARWGGEFVVTDGLGGQPSTWGIERAMRRIRRMVPDLPEGFAFHDLRHIFASALIEASFDAKRVQALLRHASATRRWTPMGICSRNQDDIVRARLGELHRAPAVQGVADLRQADTD